MTRSEFIEQVMQIIGDVQMHAAGFDDLHAAGETPESVAKDIAALVPPYAFED